MADSARRVCLIVPCYNEELRLPEADFSAWIAASPHAKVLFVDDGSRDGTVKVLQRIADSTPPGRCRVLPLRTNQGKAEAVRIGLCDALRSGDAVDGDAIGFWDCDLATPLYAVDQLVAVLQPRPRLQMVFAARVALLGRKIERNPIRHYLGRVFATLASLSLDLAIYDTQCGAKIFRVTPALRTVLAEPFMTRWVFDCEIIARFASLASKDELLPLPSEPRRGGSGGSAPIALSEAIYEYPLEEWVDVAGSKVKPADVLRMAIGLLRIRSMYFLHDWPSGKAKPAFYVTIVALSAVTLLALLALVALGLLLMREAALRSRYA